MKRRAETTRGQAEADHHMRHLLQRIATGPELSKDVSEEEARAGMQIVLQGRAHPVQAALYLIGLRMKRETDDELAGVQRALIDATSAIEVDVDEVVEIADPFNGYVRGLPMSPFLPAVLASCGYPAVSHGVETVGPKYGITHHKVLRAAGEKIDLGVRDAAARIGNPEIGWAYVDQTATCPDLYRLSELRNLMVKRTCLTTIEVALRPIRGRRRTHLVTGYVHKAYPRIYTMLARRAGYSSALIIRGVEGGVVPSLQQPSKAVLYRGGGVDEVCRFDPGDSGLSGSEHRMVPLPGSLKALTTTGENTFEADAMATATAERGMAALRGQKGLAYDSLVYSGSIILSHLYKGSQSEFAHMVRKVLDSGAAAARIGLMA